MDKRTIELDLETFKKIMRYSKHLLSPEKQAEWDEMEEILKILTPAL